MSLFRPVGKVFHQISKLQQLAPLAGTATPGITAPAPRRPGTPRPTLKVRRSAASRRGRPGTARRRLGVGVGVGPAPLRDAQVALHEAFFGSFPSRACVSSALASRLVGGLAPARHYSMEKEFKVLVRRQAKPCFAPKRLKEKPPPVDWTSPCACDYSRTIDRCKGRPCPSNVRPCPKPRVAKPYRCPRKRKTIRMKRRKPGRRVLLGYKLCVKPRRTAAFRCVPLPPVVVPELPTPRRCPCCEPREYDAGPQCKKVRCAREPADCRKRRQPPVCVICPPRK